MSGELEQLGERIAEQAAHFDAAMHRLLSDLRDFDARGGWHVQGARSCAHWLAWRVGWDLVTARDRVRVARKLAEFPAVDDALRRGEVSYSKVRAIVRVATAANEVLLLEYARLMTASQLEKLSRKYALVQRHGQESRPRDDEQRRYVRRRDTEDGMVKIEAVLHPEEAELVWTMLDHAAKQQARAPRRCRSNASAESAASPSRPATGAAWSAECAGRTDASAESSASPISATTAIGSSAVCTNNVRMDDSAESPASPSRPATGAAWSAECTGRTDASAKSQASPIGAATAIGSSAAWMSTARMDDSAESRSEEGGSASAYGTGGRSSQAGGRGVSVLHQQVDATRRAFSRADALVMVAQGYLRGERPERAPIDITLTIPVEGLRGEAMDPVEVGELGGSLVSREAARRLSCDAGVVEVLEDERGNMMSVGRKRRTISGALKRALHNRDKECTFPGCIHRLFLEGHHIKHWADGGETSLLNGLLLCSLHHRYVHEYGYAVELGPDQRPRFRDPGGRLVDAVPARPAIADLGWPRLRAVNEPLEIDAETIACEWDGTPVDYGAIVGHLVVADRLA